MLHAHAAEILDEGVLTPLVECTPTDPTLIKFYMQRAVGCRIFPSVGAICGDKLDFLFMHYNSTTQQWESLGYKFALEKYVCIFTR
jgi:hypothetical protein